LGKGIQFLIDIMARLPAKQV